jgi:hypothetical protein
MQPAECGTCGRLTTRPVYCETCSAVFDEFRQLTRAAREDDTPARVITLPGSP